MLILVLILAYALQIHDWVDGAILDCLTSHDPPTLGFNHETPSHKLTSQPMSWFQDGDMYGGIDWFSAMMLEIEG